MISDLLSGAGGSENWSERLGPGAIVLRGFATAQAANIVAEIQQIIAQAPFRHMETPGGFRMSVAMSNCGELGWVSDKAGYRYQARVHDCEPQRRDQRRQRHHRIAIGQLRRLILTIGLQQRKAAVGLVMVVGMALQVDQQPIRCPMRRIPRMPGQDVFILSRAQMAAGQAVMLDIVRGLRRPHARHDLPL